MQLPSSFSAKWLCAFIWLIAEATAYPSHWPVYAQQRDYPDDDYYYAKPARQPYYAASRYEPEVYGRIPYPYYYDPYSQYIEDPAQQDERLAALPVGQETWYENESERWRPEDLDDVNAAFLDNLILTQMAQDAQRRRENARATIDYEERDAEDEDVRELKALAGKPLYHVPKTVPRHDDEDYQGDDGFINWNGNKRSVHTTTTVKPEVGQEEIAVPRPAQHQHHHQADDKKDSSLYKTIAHMLATEKADHIKQDEPRRLNKRFVATDSDLVAELRGLKHGTRT